VETVMSQYFVINKKEKIMRWALIDANNLVENIIVWDGQGDIFVGKNIVQIQDGEWCSIGALYEANSGVRFIEQNAGQPE
jgi:hypothetical protein